MKRVILIMMAMLVCGIAFAEELKYAAVYDIPYRKMENAYASERCKLDIYYPEDTTGCPVVVWFHGGGLTQGKQVISLETEREADGAGGGQLPFVA